jgi:3-oxoacyl-[acyl-carrier protein] reductase
MRKKNINKKALVIGGSSGIGLATVKQLIKMGVEVAILGRNIEKLENIKKELGTKKYPVRVFVADASNVDSMKVVFDLLKKEFGKIDYLINSAGISIFQKQGELDMKSFNKLIEVNLNSVYISSMLGGYGLINKDGAIVNVSSIRGRTGTDSFSPGYAAAKAGVINLTKTFAMELASKNIRVNCVAPGATYPTGLSESWPKELRDNIAKSIPLKRLGNPEEIARAVLFLLSDDASYITGQTLDINGGQWMN